MCKTILCFLVAFSLFALALFFKNPSITKKTKADSIIKERPTKIEKSKFPFQELFGVPFKEKSSKEKFLSDKEKALFLFEQTLSNWLNGKEIETLSKPSDNIKEKVLSSNLNIVDERDLLDTLEKDYKSFLIDINGDSEKELAILCNHSPPEHHELWIFKKTKKDFKVILSTYNSVENFSLRKSKTKGHYDLETTASYPRSKTSLAMGVFEFDGEQYVKMKCFDCIYLYEDKHGKLRTLKKPKYISLHCC